jgi:hypothetical protein
VGESQVWTGYGEISITASEAVERPQVFWAWTKSADSDSGHPPWTGCTHITHGSWGGASMEFVAAEYCVHWKDGAHSCVCGQHAAMVRRKWPDAVEHMHTFGETLIWLEERA